MNLRPPSRPLGRQGELSPHPLASHTPSTLPSALGGGGEAYMSFPAAQDKRLSAVNSNLAGDAANASG